MRVTNKTGLPLSVVKLVSGGERPFVPNEVSVTTLIRPPQINALTRIHWDELEEDAADRIWATYGTLMHYALERMEHDNALVEEKLTLKVGDWTVTGTPDLYHDGVLSDFKFVSVWSIADGVKPEWVEQLNLYAHLLRAHGFPVHHAQIVAFYRDWSKTRAMESGYPQQQAGVHPVKLWPDERAGEFMATLVCDYERAMNGDFPDCTPEETWQRPTQYAVTKVGNKRANRLLDTQDAAVEWALANSPQGKRDWFQIARRPGEAVRCASYCQVSAWCQQRARRLEEI
jgi:hypothetical protein